MSTISVLPVLDLLDGEVVHAKRGLRSEYQRIQSELTPESSPLAVACALREVYGSQHFYLADLNSLQARGPAHYADFESLIEEGFKLTVDCGINRIEQAKRLLDCGVQEIVIASETLESKDQLETLVEHLGRERTVFSLDLQGGELLHGPAEWQQRSLERIVEEAIGLGIQRLILLDLAAVGANRGWPLQSLSQSIGKSHPGARIYSGGGIRNLNDLHLLQTSGVHFALISTALHTRSSEFFQKADSFFTPES